MANSEDPYEMPHNEFFLSGAALLAKTKSSFGEKQYLFWKELLAIRRIFSPVDMINNIIFSNCPNVFEIGVVWQQNMHRRQRNTFQSDSPFTVP